MRKAPVLVTLLLAPLLLACGADAMPPPEVGQRAQTSGTAAPEARAAAGVRLTTIGNFDSPLLVTAPRGDQRRIFVVEQGGTIRVVRGGRKRAEPFLDIRNLVTAGGEQGLLGLAFAPDYATTRRFYVYYTARDGSQNVVAYRAQTRDRADAGSARRVLRMADSEGNHNGGNLVFGPDRLLYIGTGDGGGGDDQHGARGNAQNLRSLLGKILRIDPRKRGGAPYRTPSSNPFVGRGRAEIYAYGLRNPWRFSFDRTNDALIIGDVGQNAVEEIDYAARGEARGANYGWRPFEGNDRNFDEPAPGAIAPVITHTHDAGFCSITGGVVVRDPNLPALRGRYVYGDVCQNRLWGARLAPRRATGLGPLAVREVSNVVSFGEDARGRVYVVSLNGPVYRFAAG
ncbi:MAG: PQQ-dependent sugar dehydrogenase [Solirubrobacteraceae bacterium]